MKQRFLGIFALVLGLMSWGAPSASAFEIAVGDEQSRTYNIGVGISSLAKIKLLPSHDIDLQTLTTEGDQGSLEALQNGQASFALVTLDDSQPISSADIEAVASLGEDRGLTTALLTRSDVDDASVALILQTIFENVDFLAVVDQDLRNLSPDTAVMGLSLPLHDGAKQFHASRWGSTGTAAAAAGGAGGAGGADATASTEPPSNESSIFSVPAAVEEGTSDARNYIIYFGFDDDALNQEAQATLERAANFAGTLEAPAIIVAAYTDSVGDAEYNYRLAERRASAVTGAMTDLHVGYSGIDLSLFGERSPWAVTLDDIDEASNRRVELFIEEPVPAVEPLPLTEGFSGEPPLGGITILGGSGGPAEPSPPPAAEEKPKNQNKPTRPLM